MGHIFKSLVRYRADPLKFEIVANDVSTRNWDYWVGPLTARNFWSRDHALYRKFWILAGLGIKHLVQIPIDIYVEIIYAVRLFQNALTCLNRIINTPVIEEKLYFYRRRFKFRPRSWNNRLRIQKSRPYYWCLHTNRASCKISAH
jgi:hypothetical protein